MPLAISSPFLLTQSSCFFFLLSSALFAASLSSFQSSLREAFGAAKESQGGPCSADLPWSRTTKKVMKRLRKQMRKTRTCASVHLLGPFSSTPR